MLVLVLSVALSAVLADTAEDQTLRDLDSRAVAEAFASYYGRDRVLTPSSPTPEELAALPEQAAKHAL